MYIKFHRPNYVVEFDINDRVTIDDDIGEHIYDGPLRDLLDILDRARNDKPAVVERPVIKLPDADHDRDAELDGEHDGSHHHCHLDDGRAYYHPHRVFKHNADPGHRH